MINEERFFFKDVLSFISLSLLLLDQLLDLFRDLIFMERHQGFDLRFTSQSDRSNLVDLFEFIDRRLIGGIN